MAGERLREALRMYRRRYWEADRERKSAVLDELCDLSGYHRKYAIVLLNRFEEENRKKSRRRGPSYSAQALRVVEFVWRAAGYPWSQRLKTMLPLWLPWVRHHVQGIPAEVEREVLAISPRQLDRRLQNKRRALKRRLYGRTKPGTLLKHHIPIKTDCWDVTEPGFTETDLVSHSGDCASGEFIYSVNVTDIHTAWSETRAVMGRGEKGVVAALDEMRRALPFALRALDSDNGSEFINHHLYRYCQEHHIQLTRGRPYKKDDNAHIEQKNWTHVRRIFGWDRYDTPALRDAMNDLYQNELRWMMNLFQTSVKLAHKERVGSRLHRKYDTAQTPLDRLVAFYGNQGQPLPQPVQALVAFRNQLDPLALSQAIERKLETIERLRRTNKNTVLSNSRSPRGATPHKETLNACSKAQLR